MSIIYSIKNNENNKYYIGKTVQKLHRRWKAHISKTNHGSKLKFHNAIRKYGPENWSINILEEIDDPIILAEREMYWIAHYDAFKNGYNSTTGGDKDLVFSPEIIQKMKDKRKLQVFSKEAIDKRRKSLSIALKGKKFSQERCLNISKSKKGCISSFKGQKHSEESIQKMKDNHISKNENYIPSRLGDITSIETKEKQSKAKKNKIIVNNGIKNILVSIDNFEILKEQGFKRGRLKISSLSYSTN